MNPNFHQQLQSTAEEGAWHLEFSKKNETRCHGTIAFAGSSWVDVLFHVHSSWDPMGRDVAMGRESEKT